MNSQCERCEESSAPERPLFNVLVNESESKLCAPCASDDVVNGAVIR